MKHTQCIKCAATVRADLDTSTYFLDLGGLFVHFNVDALAQQSQRSRHTANTATSNNYFHDQIPWLDLFDFDVRLRDNITPKVDFLMEERLELCGAAL
ncbi:hypothetical protein SDC9_169513 [bioreactor metagenome]|uniref:Uncharacterized protein n=1 Tax=bioreactor metagenome TaxID=1076179 RepID=A0A645G814_9ZZZZ